MKTVQFPVPDNIEGGTEVEITAWRVKAGDSVTEDQPLVELLTAKAVVEITSQYNGRVVRLFGAEGDTVAVGALLLELEVEEETETGKTSAVPHAPNKTQSQEREPQKPSPAATPARDVLASPAVRERAKGTGINLADVPGTGPDGRITEADLDAYVGNRDGKKEIRIIGLRRKIAEHMEQAWRTIPHFSYIEECDMTALEALRKELNASRREDQPKLTPLPFFMRALAQLLPEFPNINAHYDGEAGILSQYDAIHIGIATQTSDGLLVPVVRHVEKLDLWTCASEMRRVTSAARERKASREELSGSTMTLTSLGTLGGIAATPIVNHPEVAIVAPNRLVDRPVVIDNQIVVRTMMNISSSFDHRIVDGHDAASFIQRLKRLLESPALIATR